MRMYQLMGRRDALAFTAILMVLGLCGPNLSSAAAEDSIEIRSNLPLLLQTLGTLPYSIEGTGPVIYVIEFSTCPYARRFETEYGSKLAGMGFQVRRVYYGVDQATTNNAAASALSRDPAMQRAFMFEGRQAPPLNKSPQALEAYREVPDKLKVIVGVLQESGWNTNRVVSPMFIFPDGKKLFADGGYRADHFESKILQRLRLASRAGGAAPSGGTAVAPAGSAAIAAASPGAASTKALDAADQAAVFKAAGFKKQGSKWRSCDDPSASGSIEQLADLNGDGLPDAVLVEVGFCYGNTGQAFWLVSKRADGSWKYMTGGPGIAEFLKTKGVDGWPDVIIGGPGICFPVKRWNGKEYKLQRHENDGKPC